MSELSTETNPQILVNGQQQEQISSVIRDDGEKETHTNVQSVFQQVRNQIRSQVGVKAPKSGILELVQRVKDREMEMPQVNREHEGKDVIGQEKKQAQTWTDGNKEEEERDVKQEELCAIFEEKLAAGNKALRDEFEVQISQVRKEMQTYTDQALKDLECKMQSQKASNNSHPQVTPNDQQESKGPDKKQKQTAAPSLAARRGRVLTRTMTTILPKTCAPVIIGPRAKSETPSTYKGESSRIILRDPLLSRQGYTLSQSRKQLPPVCLPCCAAAHKTYPAQNWKP